MLSKLLKKDLKKDMRWMWILFVSTIAVAALSRGFKELGDSIVFFKVMTIFFDSIFYSLLVNIVLQPFLRSFLNFTKSFYSDEAYLTHTLPVTKKQLINSKFITATIENILGFLTLITSLLIRFASPTVFKTLKLLLSTLIMGNFSIGLVLTLFVILVVVEFLMFISIIFFSIVISYRAKEKRVLKTFLLTTALSFVALTILALIMIVVMAINKINLASSTLMLSPKSAFSLLLTGIIVYSLVATTFYFLTQKEFKKGVNVD